MLIVSPYFILVSFIFCLQNAYILDKFKRLQSLAIFYNHWLRGRDLNTRPSGYEPDELPAAPPRDIQYKILLAEEKGFEPLRRLHDLSVFKTDPFNQAWVFLHYMVLVAGIEPARDITPAGFSYHYYFHSYQIIIFVVWTFSLP